MTQDLPGVSDLQSVGSSSGRDTSVLGQDTWYVTTIAIAFEYDIDSSVSSIKYGKN